MADPILSPVTKGDYETIEFTALDAGGNDFVPSRVALGIAVKYGRAPVVAKNTDDDPADFDLATGETDAEGHALYRVVLREDDLAAITKEGNLACDLVLEDAAGRDSTTRFLLPVRLRATPLDPTP